MNRSTPPSSPSPSASPSPSPARIPAAAPSSNSSSATGPPTPPTTHDDAHEAFRGWDVLDTASCSTSEPQPDSEKTTSTPASLAFKVMCMDIWEDRIVCGCSDSSLRVFARSSTLQFHQVFVRRDFVLASGSISGSQRGILPYIARIAIISSLSRIVSLDNKGRCFVHDLGSFLLVNTLPTAPSTCLELAVNKNQHAPSSSEEENPTRSSRNPQRQQPHLLVLSSKTKLHLFQWKGVDLGYQLLRLLSTPERLIWMSFVQNTLLCVARPSSYHLLDLAASSYTLLLNASSSSSSSSSSRTMAIARSVIGGYAQRGALACRGGGWVFHENGHPQALLSYNSSVVHMSLDPLPVKSNSSSSSRSREIRKWNLPAPVLGVCLSAGYVVCLTAEGAIPLHLDTHRRTQDIPLSNASDLVAGHRVVFMASQQRIVFLEPLSTHSQVEALVEAHRFEHALSLCRGSSLPDNQKTSLIEDINRQFGFHLMSQVPKAYHQAMACFQQSNVQPRHVLALFPLMLPDAADKAEPQTDAQRDEALSALIPYLIHLRRCVKQGEIEEDAGETDSNEFVLKQPLSVVVDTMLLKVYLSTDEQVVGPFLAQPNQCDLESTIMLLRESGKFDALVYLLKSREQHERALKILKELSTQNKDATVATSTQSLAPTLQYLMDLGDKAYEHPRPAPDTYWQLVQQWSTEALQQDIEGVMLLFTTNDIAKDTVVLQHLKKVGSLKQQIQFLEHIINDKGCRSRSVHNELAVLYIARIKQLEREDQGAAVPRTCLRSFLERSDRYTASKLITHLPSDDLFYERGLLLGRMGRHHQALELVVDKVGEDDAMRLCGAIRKAKVPASANVYMDLLRILLYADEGKEPRIDASLRLLNTHFVNMDAVEVMRLLPDHIPVQDVAYFLEQVVCRNLDQHRNDQVVKQLRKAENLQVTSRYYTVASERVRIDGKGRCQKCGQQLSKCSIVLCRYPNGVVIDYKCMADKTVCPITNKRFSTTESAAAAAHHHQHHTSDEVDEEASMTVDMT